MVVGQAEIAAVLNLQPGEEFPPWWRDIRVGVVAAEDQPPLDLLFPDNFSPSHSVSRLLQPPDDLSGFESAAERMKTSPLTLSCEFADRGQVEAAVGYFHLGLSLASNSARRRKLEEGLGPLIMATACRQAGVFSLSLAETAKSEALASNLREEAEVFSSHASKFEKLLDLRG